MIDEQYFVLKGLNNNVVIAETSSGKEVIFIGKGIGFGKKKGDKFESTNYDKVYSLLDQAEQEKYIRLVTKETEETLLIIHEAIEKIHDAIGFRLGDQIHSALTQHLALALQRTKDETEIKNPFLTETKWLYYDTYLIAEDIVSFIFEKTGYDLPEAETGFITLHIQSAVRDSETENNNKTDLLSRCILYTEEKTDVVFDKKSVTFRRFAHHLKQVIHTPLSKGNDDGYKGIILLLKKEEPLCYNISRNLIRMIEKTTGASVSDQEVTHLLLYVKSLIEQHN